MTKSSSYVHRKLCGSHQRYNALLLFVHQQLAVALNALGHIGFPTFKAFKRQTDVAQLH